MSFRRWAVVLSGVVALAAVAAPAWADLKIGVVNYSKLMQESPQAKAAQDALRGEFAGKQKELQTQQQTLKSKEDSLQRDSATMTADQRTAAERDLRDGNRELQLRCSNTRMTSMRGRTRSSRSCRRPWWRKCRTTPGTEVRSGAGRRGDLRQPGTRYHAAGALGPAGARRTRTGDRRRPGVSGGSATGTPKGTAPPKGSSTPK